MKTICLDLRALQVGHENRGIGMYIRSLLKNINDKENQYIIYSFDIGNPLVDLGIDVNFKYTLVQTSYVSSVVRSPRDMFDILKLTFHSFKPLSRLAVDVFVQFDYVLGLPKFKSTKKLIIGYDLIPLIRKNEYMPSTSFAWRNSAGKKAKLRASLRAIYYRFKYRFMYKTYAKADHLICISESTAKSFEDILGVSKNKISVTPLAPVINGIQHKTYPPKNMPTKPYILYVGGTDTRKRIDHLVKAFNIVRGRGADIALVLAGNEFIKTEEIPDVSGRSAILNSSYVNDIHLVGFVNDEEKSHLFKNALAFVFTTAYEGFGLPILEAMAMSCPAISYDNSSIRETAGNAAILVDDGNYPNIAEAILSIHNNDALRKKLVQKGSRRVKRFSWTKTSNATIEIIDSL